MCCDECDVLIASFASTWIEHRRKDGCRNLRASSLKDFKFWDSLCAICVTVNSKLHSIWPIVPKSGAYAGQESDCSDRETDFAGEVGRPRLAQQPHSRNTKHQPFEAPSTLGLEFDLISFLFGPLSVAIWSFLLGGWQSGAKWRQQPESLTPRCWHMFKPQMFTVQGMCSLKSVRFSVSGVLNLAGNLLQQISGLDGLTALMELIPGHHLRLQKIANALWRAVRLLGET